MKLVLFTKNDKSYKPVIDLFLDFGEDVKIIYPEDHPSAKEESFSVFFNSIKTHEPTAIISFFYSKYIQSKILDLAKYALNFHPSLLPNYRGAHALNWQIINGETTSGVTVHKLTKKIDEGDILFQSSFDIDFTDDINNVLDKSVQKSKELMIDLLLHLKRDNLNFHPQITNGTEFTCKPRRPEEGELKKGMSHLKMYNMIRALAHPWPRAFFSEGSKRKYFDKLVSMDEIKNITN